MINLQETLVDIAKAIVKTRMIGCNGFFPMLLLRCLKINLIRSYRLSE